MTTRDWHYAARAARQSPSVAQTYSDLVRDLIREVERLTAHIDAARGLHEPMSGMFPPACRTCRTYDEEPVVWPCGTAAALGADPTSPYVNSWGAAS